MLNLKNCLKTMTKQSQQPPQSSARIRYIESSRSQKSQKSVGKSPSIKYLKEISPNRNKSIAKNMSSKILQFFQNYEKNPHSQISQTHRTIDHHDEGNQLFSLKPIQNFQNQRNCQTSRQTDDKSHFKQQDSRQQVLEKFQSNERKITLMRQQLQKVFQTFKTRQKQIAQMKSNLKSKDKIKNENSFLMKQIERVQQMIKEALLQRQKLKHGPFSQINKRRLK